MRKFVLKSLVLATSLSMGVAATVPAYAQLQLPGIPGLGNIPGLGGGGGGGGQTGALIQSLTINLKTALYNQLMGLALVQEAQGDKSRAQSLRATASAMQSLKEPSKDSIEKTLKAVNENPVNREGLAKVRDEEGKKKIAQAQAHMSIVILYDGLAIASAGALIAGGLKGSAALANLPALLDAAQTVTTTLPAQTENAKKFDEALKAYMAENNVPKLSSNEKAALAKKTDPNAAKQAANF